MRETRYEWTTKASFDAAHRHEAHGDHVHGHRWKVRVTFSAVTVDPKWGEPTGMQDLEIHLGRAVFELQGRTLEDMVPGVVTTPLGLAIWFYERLSPKLDGLTAVEVSDGHTWGRKIVS